MMGFLLNDKGGRSFNRTRLELKQALSAVALQTAITLLIEPGWN